MKYFINNFLIYSIVGFLVELSVKTLFFPNMDSGILNGPWLPIYGIGAVTIIIVTKKINKKLNANKFIKITTTLLIIMISMSILELIGGLIIQFAFGEVFWDYSKEKFHFGHFVSLKMTLIWGVASLIFTYLLKALSDKMIKKIPTLVTVVVFIIFLIDVLITFIKAF